MSSECKESLVAMASAGDTDQMRTILTTSQESLSEQTIQNLLTTAAKSSHLGVMTLLLTQYPSVPLDEETVRAAINTGSIPMFEALLARDPSVINTHFDRRGTPLIVACMGQQNVEYLGFLLRAGADPNQDPDAAAFPLALVAALYTDSAAIDLLLQHGARLERSGALAAACQRGNEHMVHCLLDHGARLQTDSPVVGTSPSPLCVAVRNGHASIARTLLQHGADPNFIDASGTTAIEIAEQMRSQGQDMSGMLEVLGGK